MDINRFIAEWNDGGERLLVHTSGSTGEPKPLWVEKRRMEASACMTCQFLGLQEGNTALLCLPLDYIAGKMMVVRALTCGLRLVSVEPTGHPLSTSSLLPPIDFAAMVPLQVYNSLQVEEERERLRQIRHLIIGGGAVSDVLERELSTFPHAVWSTYGMTETLSHIALRRLNGPSASPWYTPLPGVGVTVNKEGCLVVDAPLLCPQPVVTNDIAELMPAVAGGESLPRFHILGRRDNVVCSGGIKIQAEEVERLLSPHLAVPFCITRLKDERLGEAVVLLTEGAITGEEETLCRRVLPRHWVPRHFLHIDQLPLTATGKVARKEAERMAAQLRRPDSAAE